MTIGEAIYRKDPETLKVELLKHQERLEEIIERIRNDQDMEFQDLDLYSHIFLLFLNLKLLLASEMIRNIRNGVSKYMLGIIYPLLWLINQYGFFRGFQSM